MTGLGASLPGGRRSRRLAALESVLSVGAATGLVWVLKGSVPVTGLGVVYLLAVLFVAVRRGEVSALTTSVLSVLALNFFFISPRYRLTIADPRNVAALVVFMIAAVVVGRLATASRRRASEAETREREAMMIAEVASSVLGSHDLETQLDRISESVHTSTGGEVRLDLSAAPAYPHGEFAVRLALERAAGWLYGRNGSLSWTKADVTRIAAPLARLIDVALEHRRVAERVAQAEAARRGDVAKTAVLHAISHDLRSPLTAIRTAAGGLRSGGLSATDREDLLAVIETESERLTRLVGDLMDLSRIEAGAVDPREDWCDLRDVVANACSQVAGGAEDRIEVDLPAEFPLVRVDASQLERVFANLIENAVKFSPPGEPVRVSGGGAVGRVTIRVTDRGGGIPPSKRSEVFEPFVSGEAQGRGAGLGLAICRGFVEANGGRIALQTGTGQGTSFAVSFPLAEQPALAG